MNLLINFCLVFFVLVAALMVFVILMQRPKSEGLGAAFGGGVTENIFGAQTTNVLVKFTTWLAGIFFVLTFALSVLYAHHSVASSAFRRELMKNQADAKLTCACGTSIIAGVVSRHYAGTGFRQPQAQHRRVRQNHRPLVLSGIFGPVATACGPFVQKRRELFRFAREFWREQPEKSSFLSLGIEVDQRDTGFGKLEGSTRQRGHDTRKVRLVADQHQNF